MKLSAPHLKNIGLVSSKVGIHGKKILVILFQTEIKHIKIIVVGTLENELIFQKNFCIIYTGNKKENLLPFL
jgi:hypothetical protein